MKKNILFEILRSLKLKPALMKKVKIFAALGLFGFIVVSVLTIWAGVSALKYVITSTNQAISSPAAQAHLQNAKAELRQVQFQSSICWNETQSLIAVEPWIARPIIDNLKKLKVACLDSSEKICDGYECSKLKESIMTRSI